MFCKKSSKKLKAQSEQLAEKLAIPFNSDSSSMYVYSLVYTDKGLELQYNPENQKLKQKPLFIDYLETCKKAGRIHTSTIKDPLAKAVGIKPGYRPFVVDATAGLGLDGITLARLGCEVQLIERSPIMHALLDDALKRAAADRTLGDVILEKITLFFGNSVVLLPQLKKSPETILLDPMYPQSKKRPLNKKEMRVIREMVGDDIDSTELFLAAYDNALKRIVVKRPKGALKIIESTEPTHTITMKSGRFDVYMKHHL